MTDIHVTLQIDNYYEDGDTIQTIIETDIPPPPSNRESSDYDDWEQEYIFIHTGTGRTEGDAGYFVKVISSSDEALPVGTNFEFI